MSTNLAWELSTGGGGGVCVVVGFLRQTDHLTETLAHAPQRPGSLNLRWARYSRALGDGPRNFKPWSSVEDEILAGTLFS
ncbi:hypothetical protein TNCV_2125961 [Trichonephila clavipes]|nr:hypothetical protein TNCV_2125961 [Trichonephila clavipes]